MNLRLTIYGLGTFSLYRPSSYERGFPVYQAAFICPICLHQWARLAIEGQTEWELRPVHCPSHPSGCHPDINPVAGSILDNSTVGGYDAGLLDILPESLVKREFELHLRSYEVILSCPSNLSSPASTSY